ncbi:hypothetical protein BDW02DRAFT_190561 [Decorospora gaudefroyi]|uniref:Uncharacterized protein n=1 Tax=Decorospora gaudefroyi TaxID=184978 RepID=A0A6A5KMF8_9PLEO|nr:hypothetical protein BDW02DRAFT_190561 [Decorospora gaudefroyi]
MLATSGDSLITKLTSFLTVPEKAPVPDVPPPTPIDEVEPYSTLAAATANDAGKEENNLDGKPAKQPSHVKPRRSMKRSASELIVPTQTRNEQLSALAALNAVHFKEDERLRGIANTNQSRMRASLQPPRPTTQRSISSSQIELRSQYHNPAISSASLQQQLAEQTRPSRNRSRPFRSRRVLTVSESVAQTRPTPIRSTAVRSSSDPDLAKAFANPKTLCRNSPLKPCIKTKAKSATSTPPCGFQQSVVDPEPRTLRRVKTVDFEGNASKPSLSIPQVVVTWQNSAQTPTSDMEPRLSPASKGKQATKRSPSCPNTISRAKSSVADPAVTRTDVHVIAITPSWNAQNVPNDEGEDPATPTMQIIETKSGSYEVIWDDVPPEHSLRIRKRRSSSASHALETASPGAKRGLERVNTKLADWSGTWNNPSPSFKPTIVVFPDDDGLTTQYDCTVEDNEDLTVLAPPNSQFTSAAPSRISSRPASAPMTRAGSCDKISIGDTMQYTPRHAAQDSSPLSSPSRVVPDAEAPAGVAGKTRQALDVRKLSNIEDEDLKFRGHRDSVTIAHSRLMHASDVSPELFARKDSIAMAKKRMHAKNHAAVKATHQPKQVSLEALDLIADDDVPVIPLPTIKEHAAQALKKSASVSILGAAQPVDGDRHIRIMG